MRDVGAWAAWFLMMGYFKMFVGLAGDRCEALLSSPASTPLQHLRCLALLLGILAHVAGWMADYVRDPGRWAEGGGLSAAALWLFDGATVVVEATHGTIKYGEWAAGGRSLVCGWRGSGMHCAAAESSAPQAGVVEMQGQGSWRSC